jgi:hypothetical protein
MAPIQLSDELQKLWETYAQTQSSRQATSKTETIAFTGWHWNSEKQGHEYKFAEEKFKCWELSYNGRTLRYTVEFFGEQPEDGFPLYIALHGGGGAASPEEFETWTNERKEDRIHSNDGAWWDMIKFWYNLGVKQRWESGKLPGMYIAPRGITETWDLHFRPETYWLLQRLIKNLLLPHPPEAESRATNPKAQTFVDSNRIYLMGFSAGGDGVYRLSTHLADCFAAVNMSAGHPGGVKLFNLASLPICLQAGEFDNESNLKRMALTAKSSITLTNYATSMKKIDPSTEYFVHDCFIHPAGGHSGWRHPGGNYDRAQDYSNSSGSVLNRAKSALEEYYSRNQDGIDPFGEAFDTLDHNVNTGAITWLSRFSRNPPWHSAPRTKPTEHRLETQALFLLAHGS